VISSQIIGHGGDQIGEGGGIFAADIHSIGIHHGGRALDGPTAAALLARPP